jgi:hypothetical protein
VDLQIDHLDRQQKVDHRLWSWSAERRGAELAKCQGLCWEHHKQKTHAEVYGERQHGEMRTYEAGCRCQQCRAANAVLRSTRRLAGKT